MKQVLAPSFADQVDAHPPDIASAAAMSGGSNRAQKGSSFALPRA
jgi:hypothetical protein